MTVWTVYNHTHDAVYRVSAANEADACNEALKAGCLDVKGAWEQHRLVTVQSVNVLPPLSKATPREKAWLARGLLTGIIAGLICGLILGMMFSAVLLAMW